ncbi:MAG: monovalent cation/H(+) antiporter subunit G [Parasporobacterium sp.]|nr:monovalent cation/H(+) antiporter subunit G [Parasporobacterium sp.]MCR4684622.1 monovalent cation/H(+) antiporter subunit G [Lachnospiraceae bacterium]
MIQTVVAAVFIIFGLLLFATEIYGVNRFSFVMNRMHAAAIGDTLAMMSCMLGLIIYSGFNFISLKLLMVVVFLCFSSPVSSHLIMNLAVETDETADKHYTKEQIIDEDDLSTFANETEEEE